MGDLSFSLPILAIFFPIAFAVLAFAAPDRRFVLGTIIGAAIVEAAIVCGGIAELWGADVEWLQRATRAEWMPLFNIEFYTVMDAQAIGLIALTALVTTCATMFSWLADRERLGMLVGLCWLSAGALSALWVARDLVLFYTAYELMLLPLIFAMAIWGGAERRRAALTTLLYTLAGSLLMLVSIVYVGAKLGTFNMYDMARQSAQLDAAGDGGLATWAFVAFMIAFAVKAPLLPFHGWLPLAYRQAPAEVSALLSGLVSKAAFVGMLWVAIPLFPRVAAGNWGTFFAWLGIAGLCWGAITAFRQPDVRGIIAYSSLAQMGLITLGLFAIGDGIFQGWAGAYMQTINHGLISATLFLLAGVVEHRTGSGELRSLGRLAGGRPVLATIVLAVGLIALAVPGSNVFAGELLVLAGAFQDTYAMAVVAGTAVVFAALYGLRMISRVIHTDADDTPTAATESFGGDVRRSEFAVLMPLVGAMLVLSAWPNALHTPMNTGGIIQPNSASTSNDAEGAK